MSIASEAAQQQREHALRQERRSQLRGLLLLAFAFMVFLLARASGPMHLFHAGWWRF